MSIFKVEIEVEIIFRTFYKDNELPELLQNPGAPQTPPEKSTLSLVHIPAQSALLGHHQLIRSQKSCPDYLQYGDL